MRPLEREWTTFCEQVLVQPELTRDFQRTLASEVVIRVLSDIPLRRDFRRDRSGKLRNIRYGNAVEDRGRRLSAHL